MLRSAFCLALLFLIFASVLVAPAYSFTARESGPLTAFRLQYPQAVDVPTVGPASGEEFRTDFGAIDLGELEYNGNPGRTLIYGSGNVGALGGSARIIGLGGSMENGQPMLGLAVSESPLP